MTMRHTLMLLAATAAPLYAQQGSTAVPPAQAPEAPAAVTPATPAAAEQAAPATAPASQLDLRTAALPAMALMPAEVDNFIATGNLAPVIKTFLPLQLPSHISMAIGSTGNTAEFLCTFLSSVNINLSENSSDSEIVNAVLQTLAIFKDQKIAPAYLVFNVNPPSMGGEITGLTKALTQNPETAAYCTAESINGFDGVKVNLEAWLNEALSRKNSDSVTLSTEAAAIVEAFKGRSLYIMTKLEGTSQVLAAAEDPAAVKIAANPSESVLSTDRVSEIDSTPQGVLLLSYMSPETTGKVNRKTAVQFTNQLTQLITPLLTTAENAPAADKEAVQKALQSLDMIKQAYLSLIPESVVHPYTVKSWLDDDLHLEIKADAGKVSYEQGTLRMTAQAQDPMTALYAEGTACRVEGMPSAGELLDACEQLLTGLTRSSTQELSGREMAELKQALAFYQMFKPMVMKVGEGFSIMNSGLGNSAALVVKAQPDPMVPAAAAYCAPVTSREKLAEGWKLVLDTVTTATVAFGGNADVLSMLPITEQEIPGGHAYTIALPTNTPACTPTVHLTGDMLVIGSTQALNSELSQSTSTPEPFAGTVVTINCEPVALIARSIATQMMANSQAADECDEEEELITAASVDSDNAGADADTDAGAGADDTNNTDASNDTTETTDADGTADADGTGDTDDEYDIEDEYDLDVEYGPASEEEEAAIEADEIASVLEFVAMYVRSIHATNEIKDGKNIVRMDIILRK